MTRKQDCFKTILLFLIARQRRQILPQSPENHGRDRFPSSSCLRPGFHEALLFISAVAVRSAGGKTTGADISAAIQADHSAVTFVHHRIGLGNTMFHAERVKRKPHITACLAAELAHHRQVALIGADHHAAAEEIENSTLGRLRTLSHNQAGKAVHCNHFIIRLAVGGRKNATMPVLLFNFLSQCILRQGERLFRAGELVYAA